MMKYRRTSRILISQRRYGIINSRKVLIYNRNLPNRSSSFWPATLNFSLVSHKCVTCLKITRSTASCVACKEKLHTKCLTDRLDNGMELFCTICFVNDDQNTSNFDETDDLPVYEDLNSFSRARELKIYHQNLNGLISKTNHIRLLFQQAHKNIHILGISESHLNKHITNKGVMVEGYTTIRKDRSTGTGAAICMYIKNDLNWQEQPDLQTSGIEELWIEMFIQKSKSILLCTLYRLPDSSKHLMTLNQSLMKRSVPPWLMEKK